MNKEERKILNKIYEIDDKLHSVYLKGSKVKGSESDYWSDVDLTIVSMAKSIDETYAEKLDVIFQPVQARQIFKYENCITYRVTTAVDSIIQFDIQVVDMAYFKRNMGILSDVELILGEPVIFNEMKSERAISSHQEDKDSIDNTWFMYYEAVKKIARKDNLIGLHLIFDLIKEYLVLDMIDRDIRLKTNIHRFGSNEKLPQKVELSLLQSNKITDKLIFLNNLAQVYDDKLQKIHKDYISRYNQFAKHIETSISHLE